MNKGLGRIRKTSESCGENIFMAERDHCPSQPIHVALPWCLWSREGPSTTVCPSWIAPCCHTGQDYHSLATGKKSILDLLLAKTTLSHPCGYSNSFNYLKATCAGPGHVGSCIPQHRPILNVLCPFQSQQDEPGILTAHSTFTAQHWQENSTKIDSSRD